jgi:MazG family protein
VSDAFNRLVKIMDRLRDPGGCPWDREQDLHTLSSYLIEEAYEVVEAIGAGGGAKLGEELGDLLLQIVFMARVSREHGWFGIEDVCNGISDKMVRRHPHVFADRNVNDSTEVVRNWEDIKKRERRDSSEQSALDGVPNALPALLKAFRMTEKASALGFDWRRPEDVIGKLHEEVEELELAVADPDEARREMVREEIGDVLFVLANLCRKLDVEPETALQTANAKFKRRFIGMEELARKRNEDLRSMNLNELDELWDEVKAGELSGSASQEAQNKKARRR